MKRSGILLLLIAMLFQSTSMLWSVGAFYLNRQYIAKNLCVNRLDPVTICEGSCYLEKQISKEREKDQQLPDIKLKDIQLFCQARDIQAIITVADKENPPLPYPPQLYTYDYHSRIFHPPATV